MTTKPQMIIKTLARQQNEYGDTLIITYHLREDLNLSNQREEALRTFSDIVAGIRYAIPKSLKGKLLARRYYAALERAQREYPLTDMISYRITLETSWKDYQ